MLRLCVVSGLALVSLLYCNLSILSAKRVLNGLIFVLGGTQVFWYAITGEYMGSLFAMALRAGYIWLESILYSFLGSDHGAHCFIWCACHGNRFLM